MTGTDVHFLTLLARQREAELNRELHLRRLLREANSSARPAEPTPMPAPVMRAWLRLAAGQRPVGG